MKNLYSTKLVSHSTKFLLPIGILFLFFGISSIVLSSIDFKSQSIVNGNSVLTTHTEQSIWPTIGKGIWCGVYFVGLGIFCLIVYREKTLISIRILCFAGFLSIFLSLFLFLSSILVYQRFIIEGRLQANQRTSDEQRQVILNALLFVCGVLALITSVILTIGTLITGLFCQSKSDEMDNLDPYYPQAPPAYSAPSIYR